jgi:hypothetical protein
MQFDQNPVAEIAAKYINNTSCNVFLTGKAGTGKTTFLRNICQYTHKNTLIAAPTGIAAINAGGVTLHSLFQLPFGAFIPENTKLNGTISIQLNTPQSLISSFQMNNTKRNLLRETELLIIDEVSMLRADLLDAIDTLLRFIRRKKYVPFGGVQVLFIGDLQQLPPVVNDTEWKVLSRYYQGIFFFNARVLKENPPLYIELEKIYRQQDKTFIELLNSLRENRLGSEHIKLLNSYCKPGFKADISEQYINLTTHNKLADDINSQSLKKLPGRSFFYEAIVENEFSEYQYPIDFTLELKVDAQVMFIKNDYSGAGRYFNGKIGKISSLSDTEIVVTFSDCSLPATVERYVWENKKFSLNAATNEIEEMVSGLFKQYPIRLAWAITVHKSQGLTFEKAIIDVSRAFAPGQIYVALSRLTSLDGLVLLSPLPDLMPSQDEDLGFFSSRKKSLNDLESTIERDSLNYILEAALGAFDFSNLIHSLKYHTEGYDKDEQKSVKQQFKPWAEKLYSNTLPLKDIGDKFHVQLKNIVQKNEGGYMLLLHKRVIAAKEYFEPRLKEFSENVTTRIRDLSTQKRIKKYLNELADVERLYFKQLRLIYKAEALVFSVINNSTVSKETLKNNGLFKDRKNAVTTEPKSNAKKPKDKKKEKNTEKTDTKLISLCMFNNGQTVTEIAKERGMAVSTIEGHLSHFVREGILEVSSFLSQIEVGEIVSAIHEFETTSLNSLMEALEQKYSYEKLKMGVAHFQHLQNSGPDKTQQIHTD